MNKPLESEFHEAMLGIYDRATKLKPPYRATYFRGMVLELGGKAAADKLLASRTPSEGFGTLLLRGKDALKISVEHLVLEKPWRELFTDAQLEIARKRLKEVGRPTPE